MVEDEIPSRDYRYKVELADDIINVRRIYGDTKRQNWEILRKGRKGIFKPTLNVREKDLKVTRRTASEYGEFIASLIAKQISIPACDVELVRKRMYYSRSKSGKSEIVPGCISYSDLKDGESLVLAINILAWYKSEHEDEYFKIMDPLGLYDKNDYSIDPNNASVNNNLELVIPAFEAYIKEVCGGTQEDCDEIRQSIIDMVTFDCRYANRDRNDENYGLGIGPDGKVRFYSIFDNEYILGFSEVEEDILKYSAARLQEHINKDLYSTMGISSKPTKISSTAMMTYLFTTYPEETKKAYDKISNFKENDLIEIMEQCEGLPDVYKEYASKIFRMRQRELEAIKEEYVDANGNLIPQGLLPGNKPMEILPKGNSGSKSRKSGEKAKSSRSKREAPSLDD